VPRHHAAHTLIISHSPQQVYIMEQREIADVDSDSEVEDARIRMESYEHVVLGNNPLQNRVLDHAELELEVSAWCIFASYMTGNLP
jgi:hypothetical protein